MDRQFPLPACEKLRYLRRLKRALPNSASGDNGSAGVSHPTVRTYNWWDGAAWIKLQQWNDSHDVSNITNVSEQNQQISNVISNVLNETITGSIQDLGRPSTSRGLTQLIYHEFPVNPGGTIKQILPGNPMRRCWFWMTDNQAKTIGFSQQQMTTATGQGGLSPNQPEHFLLVDEERFGAWVREPVWINDAGGDLVPMQVWEEVYVVYRPPPMV